MRTFRVLALSVVTAFLIYLFEECFLSAVFQGAVIFIVNAMHVKYRAIIFLYYRAA